MYFYHVPRGKRNMHEETYFTSKILLLSLSPNNIRNLIFYSLYLHWILILFYFTVSYNFKWPHCNSFIEMGASGFFSFVHHLWTIYWSFGFFSIVHNKFILFFIKMSIYSDCFLTERLFRKTVKFVCSLKLIVQWNRLFTVQ